MLDLPVESGMLRLRDTEVACRHFGHGPRLLMLHGGAGPTPGAPYLDALAAHFEIILPTHPGFYGSPHHKRVGSVDDLAYLYLDLIDDYRLDKLTVMGFSMGGWLALELATKSCARLERLLLVDAVGVKFTDRETRQFPDIFAMAPDKVGQLMFHDPAYMTPDFAALSDEELAAFVTNREALIHYVWEPYLHNPKLLARLHRVTVPVTCIWGESDGLTTPDYGRQLAAALPNARFEAVPQAGHAPQLEQPQAFVAAVLAACGR
ncbi:MAG: alpha/beta fold hydrolase [Immundisolibacter sp.]|uniref:alpha/beta fold hydrolase n=1 Tax=Immundisolibacter sp. TaxID=1934948 RepID=UPI003EDF85F6